MGFGLFLRVVHSEQFSLLAVSGCFFGLSLLLFGLEWFVFGMSLFFFGGWFVPFFLSLYLL